MDDTHRDLLQRAYNALCTAEQELDEVGYAPVGYAHRAQEFRNRIGAIRRDLGHVAFPDVQPPERRSGPASAGDHWSTTEPGEKE